ncbi:unnamed protein product [Boreogadus saida]
MGSPHRPTPQHSSRRTEKDGQTDGGTEVKRAFPEHSAGRSDGLGRHIEQWPSEVEPHQDLHAGRLQGRRRPVRHVPPRQPIGLTAAIKAGCDNDGGPISHSERGTEIGPGVPSSRK